MNTTADTVARRAGFQRIDGELCCDGFPLSEVARLHATPTYVYSSELIREKYRRYDAAFGDVAHLVCYAAKANSTMGVLGLLAAEGAGFDIVSQGELMRVLHAGGNPKRIVFSGVGKTRSDIAAGLAAGIRCFNVESLAELKRIDAVARELGVVAPVSMRVNPDVDPHTNARIATGLKSAKFGIALRDVKDAYRRAAELANLRVEGISCHIGSQVSDPRPYEEMTEVLFALLRELDADGIRVAHVDFGGGAAVAYREGDPELAPEALVARLAALTKEKAPYPVEILIEPGRSIVAEAGVLLTTVEYVKPMEADADCCIVDASMTELIRPTLYDAWHRIEPVAHPARAGAKPVNIVGPVCESSDWLGSRREIDVAAGDVLAVCTAGAYGMSMASNYNSRPLPAEVMIEKGQMTTLRERQDVVELFAAERAPECAKQGSLDEEAFERVNRVRLAFLNAAR